MGLGFTYSIAKSGALVSRIHDDLPAVVHFLTFSPDGRYLAAALGPSGPLGPAGGLRVFDRDRFWNEAFRDQYSGDSYGAAFAPDGRLATTTFSSGGEIRLYNSTFFLVGTINTPSGYPPWGIAFSPDGRRLAVGYHDIAAVDLLDGASLAPLPRPSPMNLLPSPVGLAQVAWSRDGRTLFAGGAAEDASKQITLLAWDGAGLDRVRRLTYCAGETAGGIATLPDGSILVASMKPCLGLISATGEQIWTKPFAYR